MRLRRLSVKGQTPNKLGFWGEHQGLSNALCSPQLPDVVVFTFAALFLAPPLAHPDQHRKDPFAYTPIAGPVPLEPCS